MEHTVGYGLGLMAGILAGVGIVALLFRLRVLDRTLTSGRSWPGAGRTNTASGRWRRLWRPTACPSRPWAGGATPWPVGCCAWPRR